MRILYVSSETPLSPAGGIATYLRYVIPAMKKAGHEVHLLTWRAASDTRLAWEGLDKEEITELILEPDRVWAEYPHGPFAHAQSKILSTAINQLVESRKFDVVEATDFRGPAFFAFTSLRGLPRSKRPLCVTFNHGLSEDVYWAASLRLSAASGAEAILERQQCRISDLILSPSRYSSANLRAHGLNNPIAQTLEPFEFTKLAKPAMASGCVTHLGRVAIAKGVDRTTLLVNALHEVHPLRRLLFIGGLVDDPFTSGDIRDYILGRLSKDVAAATAFTGAVPREAAESMLQAGDYAPHLSLSETFSYALLETLDHGQLPLVMANTPMAEFFPEDLHDFLIDPNMHDLPGTAEKISRTAGDIGAVISRLQDFNRERLDPGKIADSIAGEFESRLPRQFARSRSRESHSASDITVLMAAYRPNHEFYEAVDSLAIQTSGPPRLLICDDGNENAFKTVLEYASAVLPEVAVVSRPRGGLLASRNELIRHCSTPLSLFLDADDLLHPSTIEESLEAMNAEPSCQAVIPLRRTFGESDETVLRYNLDDYSHFNWNDLRMTALIRTEILKEIMFDSTRRNGEADDWIFWLEFATRGHVARLLAEPRFLYRLQQGSMSWPWNPGQGVGTAKMLMDLTANLEDKPYWARMVSRAHSLARITDL